jgi:hypothetical protein
MGRTSHWILSKPESSCWRSSFAIHRRHLIPSAASSDIRSLLISLVEDLAAHSIVQQPAEFEQDANKFSDQIKALLSSIANPVVIFLDALDQLRKPCHLEWLPEKLPAALKLVVSVLDDADYETDSGAYQSLTQRLAPHAFFKIEPLGPEQGHEILVALEREASRSLRAVQLFNQPHVIPDGNCMGATISAHAANNC